SGLTAEGRCPPPWGGPSAAANYERTGDENCINRWRRMPLLLVLVLIYRDHSGVVVVVYHAPGLCWRSSMMRWKSGIAGVVVAVVSLTGVSVSRAEGAGARAGT